MPRSKSTSKEVLNASKQEDLPTHAFPDKASFESFLEQNHLVSPGIWLKHARKCSGIPSLSVTDSIEVGLMFGWINGQGRSIDSEWYASRFTPRRPRSMWSKINVDLVRKLTAEGKMRPAGLRVVEEAKRDGRWERAYASPSTIQVPEDFERELSGNEVAREVFGGLSKSDRYAVLWKIETGAVSTRDERIRGLVDMLERGEVPDLGLKHKSMERKRGSGTGKRDDHGERDGRMTGNRKNVTSSKTEPGREDQGERTTVKSKEKKVKSGRVEKIGETSQSEVRESLRPGLRSRTRGVT